MILSVRLHSRLRLIQPTFLFAHFILQYKTRKKVYQSERKVKVTNISFYFYHMKREDCVNLRTAITAKIHSAAKETLIEKIRSSTEEIEWQKCTDKRGNYVRNYPARFCVNGVSFLLKSFVFSFFLFYFMFLFHVVFPGSCLCVFLISELDWLD